MPSLFCFAKCVILSFNEEKTAERRSFCILSNKSKVKSVGGVVLCVAVGN